MAVSQGSPPGHMADPPRSDLRPLIMVGPWKGGSNSAAAERPRDASCLSALSSSNIIMRAQSSIISYFGLRFTAAYN